MSRFTLTIHHPDSKDDPYALDSLTGSGPATLTEAVRAEAEIVAGDADGVTEAQVFAEALRELQGKRRYRDALGVLWTVEEL